MRWAARRGSPPSDRLRLIKKQRREVPLAERRVAIEHLPRVYHCGKLRDIVLAELLILSGRRETEQERSMVLASAFCRGVLWRRKTCDCQRIMRWFEVLRRRDFTNGTSVVDPFMSSAKFQQLITKFRCDLGVFETARDYLESKDPRQKLVKLLVRQAAEQDQFSLRRARRRQRRA